MAAGLAALQTNASAVSGGGGGPSPSPQVSGAEDGLTLDQRRDLILRQAAADPNMYLCEHPDGSMTAVVVDRAPAGAQPRISTDPLQAPTGGLGAAPGLTAEPAAQVQGAAGSSSPVPPGLPCEDPL
ncbi:MAG: hypothetical protein ACRD0U_11900 [Acidimicrobiales bacterium]